MVTLDFPTIRKSATTALVVIVPSTVLAAVLVEKSTTDSGPPGPLALAFLMVTMFGFASAGYAAGRLRPDTPMAHGAMGALLAWAIVQAFGSIRRISAGQTINWVAYPVWAIIAATAGVLGAIFADWHRRS